MPNSKIMTIEQLHKMGRYPTPYTFVLKNPAQCLFYFGAEHVAADPKNFQLDMQKHYFADFLMITKKKDCVAIVEGIKRRVPPKATEESERTGGEVHYMAFLAERAGIEYLCVEPPLKAEVELLSKSFSREEIITYYFVRGIRSWLRRRGNWVSFEDYAANVLSRYKRESEWDDYDFSLEATLANFKRLMGKEFNAKDEDYIKRITSPYNKDTVLGKVSEQSAEVRDEYIVSELVRLWKEGMNIFVTYGKSHAVVQEPALRDALLV
jgi:hypothetical protein